MTINTEQAKGLKTSTGKTKTNHLTNQMRQKKSGTEQAENRRRIDEKPGEGNDTCQTDIKHAMTVLAASLRFIANFRESEIPSRAAYNNRHNTNGDKFCTP